MMRCKAVVPSRQLLARRAGAELESQTLNGRDAILKTLKPQAATAQPGALRSLTDRAAPRKVIRAGTNSIEAI